MRSHRFATIPILLVVLCCIPSSKAPARQSYLTVIPPDSGAIFEIDFDDGGSLVTPTNDSGASDQVALQPGQTIDVTVQMPMAIVGDTISIEPLDGGCLLDDNGQCIDPTTGGNQAVVQQDGTICFTFQGGNDPGVNQVSLHDGNLEVGLQFWVIDPNDPNNAPPVLTESSDDSGN